VKTGAKVNFTSTVSITDVFNCAGGKAVFFNCWYLFKKFTDKASWLKKKISNV